MSDLARFWPSLLRAAGSGSGRAPGEFPVQRGHALREPVNGEQAGFENLALVEHQAVDAAHERGLVVHLGPIPETAAQLTQPADPDRQSGFLTDLPNDRLLERLAPP